jgi:uncharacterized protein with PQ loop repeat
MCHRSPLSSMDPKYVGGRRISPGVDPEYNLKRKDLPFVLCPLLRMKRELVDWREDSVNRVSRKSPLGRHQKRVRERVYRSGVMRRLGLDLGTKHIVLSYRDKNKLVTRYEVNGYLVLPGSDNFAKQLLVKQGVPFVSRGSELIAIGQKAEKLAFTFNRTLKRPMAEGGVSKTDDDAQEIIAIIIRSIIGKLNDDAILYYCTTAKPINNDTLNIDFHRKVVKLIIEGYAGEAKIRSYHINEARCLVMEEQSAAIGISWGAGTITVHAGIFGVPIFEFSITGAGDWIDIEAAKRFGYDPCHPGVESNETPTSICRRKMSDDFNLLKIPKDNVGRSIYLMYEILVENVVKHIVRGFNENRGKYRFDSPVNIVNAGGTSMPRGFLGLLSREINKVRGDLNIPIGEIKQAENPLFAVSCGCLLAAELHQDE